MSRAAAQSAESPSASISACSAHQTTRTHGRAPPTWTLTAPPPSPAPAPVQYSTAYTLTAYLTAGVTNQVTRVPACVRAPAAVASLSIFSILIACFVPSRKSTAGLRTADCGLRTRLPRFRVDLGCADPWRPRPFPPTPPRTLASGPRANNKRDPATTASPSGPSRRQLRRCRTAALPSPRPRPRPAPASDTTPRTESQAIPIPVPRDMGRRQTGRTMR